MDSENAFWMLTAISVAGIFALLISGSFVSPVNAAQAGGQYGAQAQAGSSPAGGQPAAGASGGSQLSAPAGGGAQPSGTLAPTKNGAQEVSLSVQGSNYYPNPIRVKKGVPVRLVADVSKVPGCAKSIVIPEFGVRKVVRAGDNVIEFTPDKSGTFDFSCSMGMYRGTIVVEEADGTVAAFTGNAPKVAGGSCGAGGGGCGCGG